MSVDHIALRPCTSNDAEALAVVGTATFLDAYAGWIDGPSIIAFCARHHTAAAYAHSLSLPATHAWIAETTIGNAPIGYALLTAPDLPLPDLDPGDLELKRIYLLTRFHKTGTGQRLMDLAIKTAQNQSAARLLLGVHQDNVRALNFYTRNDFHQIGTRRFQVGANLYDDLILGRSL